MDSTEYTYIPADTQEWTRPAPLTQATALQQAQHHARKADEFYRQSWPAAGDESMQRAVQYAALAQAEALTRIAEVLEQHLDDAAHDGLRRLIETTFGD